MLPLSPRSRKGLGLLALLVLAAAFRWPFWREALRTPLDGDTALVGLMARHPTRTGSTLWGQPYGSPLEAWLLAPVLAMTGPRPGAVRAFYFALGLLLVPAAVRLGRATGPGVEWPAGVLAASPPAYLLLQSASPPPLYPLALLLGAGLLVGALGLERRLATGSASWPALAGWGLLAGLALWTHLMSLAVVAICLVFLAWRAGPARRRLGFCLAGLALGATPLVWSFDWRVAAGARPRTGALEHLLGLLPSLHVPLLGLLGAHSPLICDDPDTVVTAPWPVAVGLAAVALWALAASWRAPRPPAVTLLGLCGLASLVLFVAPARSGPHALRFLTPVFLPLTALLARGLAIRLGPRRVWAGVALLCGLQAVASFRLLRGWQGADRSVAPFALLDLRPVQAFLEARGLRHAYAEYATAYRLTFESGERVIASPPWNERFRHHPLPYLDAVRAAGRVAWILRDTRASDLPTTARFEHELARIGGGWRRQPIGDATVYWDFQPPFSAVVEHPTGPAAATDGDVSTFEARQPGEAIELQLDPARPAAAVTVLTPPGGPGLPRAFAVEASLDGRGFEPLDRWRPEDARSRPCWLNGHPQYAAARDAVSLSLPPRPWRALRLVSLDPRERWAVAELLLHPGREPGDGSAAPAEGPSADALFRRMLAARP